MEKQTRKRQDVINILSVLGAAIFCAALMASWFIYYYGPSGRYSAGQTILDPTVMERINYQDKHPLTGQNVHFMFDRIEFSYFDSQQGQMRRYTVLPENYQKLYQLMTTEKSVEHVTDSIRSLFTTQHPTLLTIYMHVVEPSGKPAATHIFQVIQFVPEDYARVQLHGQQNQGEWIYFYRPQLYQDIMRLFTTQ